MNRVGKRILVTVMALGLSVCSAPYMPGVQAMTVVEAHHGASHHSGHRNSNSYSGYTDNNYYCGGHEAHQHNNGVCPYTDYYCGGHGAHQHNNGVCPYTDYYCGGHEAHQHHNGICPYSQETVAGAAANTQEATAAVQPEKAVNQEVVRQLQQKLSDAGYDCGKADGIWGENSRTALKSYQTDHSLTADGCIRDEVLNALAISG